MRSEAMEIAILGIDLGKNSCSVVGIDLTGIVSIRRRMRRDTVIAFCAKLPACIHRDGGVLRGPSGRRPAGTAGAYSQDLRDRVIDAVVREEMSRRAAAARFEASESSAVKWVQRFERSGSRAASKMGGYLRPKLEPHREFLEARRTEKTDITLQALCDRLLAERVVRTDTSMMSRFFRRIGVTVKKDAHRAGAGSSGHKAPPKALAKPSEARRSFQVSRPATTSSSSTIWDRTKERSCENAIKATGARFLFLPKYLARPQPHRAGLRQAQDAG
jgi:transposase